MEEIETRVRMAAESILENESLRDGLDKDGTETLLEWGTACAKQIARETSGEDDEEIEEAMYPRMRALRKLLGVVKTFVNTPDIAARINLLNDLLELAAILYAPQYTPPEAGEMGALVASSGLSQRETLLKIRNLFENTNQGETND
jgi:hypothetical protein